MNNHSFEGAGILTLIGCAALYFIARRYFPGLSALLLVIGAVLLILLIAFIVLMFFLGRSDGGKKASDGQRSLLDDGRARLLELRRMNLRIRDKSINEAVGEVCRTIEQILTTLKQKPEKIPAVRRFFNYYLPTLTKIVQKYLGIEESGIPAEQTKASVLSGLSEIRTAMQKLYESLYDDDKLDLSVEMDVLKMICKQDGLLSDEDFPDTDANE